jgi:hypothetical protein
MFNPHTVPLPRALLFVLLLGAAGAACAQRAPPPPPPSPITDHLGLRASAFLGTVSTDGVVDDPTSAVRGTPFSLESDFGLGNRVRQPRPELIMRLRERGRLRFDLWELNRSSQAVPQLPITYGGHTFTNTDLVQSRFDWRQMNLTWTYSIVRNRRFELGAGFGVHLLQVEARAHVAPSSTRPTGVTEDFSSAGPFMSLALDGTWVVSPRFAATARANYLKLKIGSVNGAVGDYHADLQFRWRPNLAFGVGYLSTRTRFDVTNNNPNGSAQIATHGPELFLRASF